MSLKIEIPRKFKVLEQGDSLGNDVIVYFSAFKDGKNIFNEALQANLRKESLVINQKSPREAGFLRALQERLDVSLGEPFNVCDSDGFILKSSPYVFNAYNQIENKFKQVDDLVLCKLFTGEYTKGDA